MKQTNYKFIKDNGLKTLVVHPTDGSTDFLSIIYENHLEDWDIINDCNITKEELKQRIESVDRVIFMGHGTPKGLLNPATNYKSLIVDDSFADLLKTKDTVSIWCNSDYYFRRHGIKGFHTGMVISEVSEAEFVFEETPLNEKETLDNMVLMSECFRDCIEELNPEKIKAYMLKHYVGTDPITDYNRQSMIVLNGNEYKA